ncbi:MAG: AEC family transporter [Acetobacterales bacterium]
MLQVFHAIAPIALVLGAGYALKRSGFPGDEFWPPAERLVYWLLFPALMVISLANRPLDTALLPMAAAMVGSAVAVGLLLLLARPLVPVSDPAFSSIVQGSVRFNTYIGFSAAAALYGSEGIALLTVPLAAMLPTVNIISVYGLSRYGAGGSPTPLRIATEVARNPFIVSGVIGVGLNLSGIGVPRPFDGFMQIMGGASLPIGLLAVGAGLRVGAVRERIGAITFTCIIKLLLVPTSTWLLCGLLGVEGEAVVLAVLFSGLAAAPASYVMAKIMGGDAELMSGIVTVETLLSLLTLSAILLLLL